jgi:hypothetical protein
LLARSASGSTIADVRRERKRKVTFSYTWKLITIGGGCTRRWATSARRPLNEPIVSGTTMGLTVCPRKRGNPKCSPALSVVGVCCQTALITSAIGLQVRRRPLPGRRRMD